MEVNTEVVGELTFPLALRRILQSACELVDARYGVLAVFDTDGTLEQLFHVGLGPARVAAIDDLHIVEAMMLQRAFLPPLRRFADEGLKQLGIDIAMTDTEWHEAGMLIVERMVNGETLAANTHPRDVVLALADDGVLSHTSGAE